MSEKVTDEVVISEGSSKSRVSWVQYVFIYVFSLIFPVVAAISLFAGVSGWLFVSCLLINVGLCVWTIFMFRGKFNVVLRRILIVVLSGIQLFYVIVISYEGVRVLFFN